MGDKVNALNAQSGETGKGDASPCVVQSVSGDISHTLKAEGADASEDGTGRGTPIIGFQTRGSNIDIGQISGTIGTNADRASGSAPMIAHVVAPPLTATNDPSRSPQSAEVTAQVHAVLQAQTIAHVDVVGTLSDGAHNGGGLNGQDAYTGRILPVAFDARQNYVLLYGDKTGPLDTHGHSVGVCVSGDRTHSLRASLGGEDGTGRGTPIVRHGNMAVRRLTPRECERLQGFPDDYTRIPYKKKSADECPDGPRYKALGNSMAVPCMNWLGRKINAEYWKRHDVD